MGDLNTMRILINQLYDALDGKVGIIAYDYEGYGFSSGTVSEKNCYNDLTYIVAHAIKTLEIKKEKLILIGQSLGTGIVVDFCCRHDWTMPIVLISPYKSIARVIIDVDSQNHITGSFIDSIINSTINSTINSIDQFTTHHKIEKLSCNIIIYHGKKIH